MQVGDTQYKAAVRRWAQLYDTHPRTFEQEMELAALHKRLDAAERQGVIERATNDYHEIAAIGDLGGVELT